MYRTVSQFFGFYPKVIQGKKNRIKIKRKKLKQNYGKFAKTHGKHWIYLHYAPTKYNRKIIHLLYRYFYLYKNYTKNRL